MFAGMAAAEFRATSYVIKVMLTIFNGQRSVCHLIKQHILYQNSPCCMWEHVMSKMPQYVIHYKFLLAKFYVYRCRHNKISANDKVGCFWDI